MSDETSRLAFIRERDGDKAATEFARCALLAYRTALKRKSLINRRSLVTSCLSFRSFLRQPTTSR